MMERLKEELDKVLRTNILSFWIIRMQDEENGGFYGRIDGYNRTQRTANKGAVLNARILWTFSAAYRLLGKDEYRQIADRAYNYIIDNFIDPVNGGVYWELDYRGNVINSKKQTYAQGFALYGFSEYYRATGNPDAKEWAKKFFFLIEEKCKDKEYGGYFEAFTHDWQTIDDMRLSEKDANERKSMNTHLHILEPYTNLYRIWMDECLELAQRELIEIFIKHILNKNTGHLQLFFTEDWICKSSVISYGHDIEASWLLYEAANELKDQKLIDSIKKTAVKIVNASIEGLTPVGGLIYESDIDHKDTDLHWWVQAEAVTGLFYAFHYSGNKTYLQLMKKNWEYIRKYLIDMEHGEWYWSTNALGKPNFMEDKAGFWKCPYHNGRMCMELLQMI